MKLSGLGFDVRQTFFKKHINFVDDSGERLLHLAVKEGDLEQVRNLIDLGEDPDVLDQAGRSALYRAMEQNQLTIVAYLSKLDKVEANIQDQCGNTPLHFLAPHSEYLPLMRMLVEKKKVNIDCCNDEGFSALSSAVDANHLDGAVYLLRKGAKVVDCDIILAMERCNLLMIEAFDAAKCINPVPADDFGRTWLHFAAYDLDISKYFIKKFHISPYQKDSKGRHVVHFASAIGTVKLLDYYVRYFMINPFETDNLGRSPLHFAAHRKTADIFKYLIREWQLLPLERDCDGNQPIHCAARSGSQEVLHYILQKDPQAIFSKNHQGQTILQLAIEYQQVEIVEDLIRQDGIDVNVCDARAEQTPLHFLAMHGKYQSVSFLLRYYQFNLNQKDREGYTPKQRAFGSGAYYCFVRFKSCSRRDSNARPTA